MKVFVQAINSCWTCPTYDTPIGPWSFCAAYWVRQWRYIPCSSGSNLLMVGDIGDSRKYSPILRNGLEGRKALLLSSFKTQPGMGGKRRFP